MSADNTINKRYLLEAQQGAGGMAVIYKALDIVLGRRVAVKILRPSLTGDPEFIKRFQNEARAIANLSNPNIVTVHDVGQENGPQGSIHYMVMEFIDGFDLKKLIRAQNDQPLRLDIALEFAVQICNGIGFAHRSAIVHADVKPQNILVTLDQQVVKVTDFGIAQALSETQAMPTEREQVVWGSPHYFSPEQAKGERPTPASDVYSIGIVMFEMMTGRLPFNGSSQKELAEAHVATEPPLVSDVNPSVPRDIVDIVRRCMDKNPANRFRDGAQLASMLRPLRDRAVAQFGYSHQTGGTAPSRPMSPPPAQDSRSVRPVSGPQTPMPPPAGSQPMPQAVPPRAPTPPPARPAQFYAPPVSDVYTQRASPAPDAPVAPQYQQRNAPAQQPAAPPFNPVQRGYTPPPQPPADNNYYSRPMRPTVMPETRTSLFDPVTITLGILAAVAVACLIPLFLAALGARG